MRSQKKITQIALCHKIRMEQKTLSAVENGRMEPCRRNIELLAIGLGGPLVTLFKGCLALRFGPSAPSVHN